ncbi:MAG TPA: DNA gyrase subunit A [Candidatus Nanoarchaeia archaeon]|nr:DNA gyrase subunit A [Candidatus Nanoarchaeia archaeon]
MSKIKDVLIQDEMKRSYLDYSMSVIVSRALPDVKDGLKPVHRRILFAMHEMGLEYNKTFKKSARIVGDCMGKYHPHGDAAIYDSLIRMAQNWSLRYPLVFGQGNMGSIDGDAPASMRYTEAKLAKISKEILEDIDKETVDERDNYDSTLKEPIVLPVKIPNLLLNGSSGIAVGMATNIPSHNLGEVCDAISYFVDNQECDYKSLMQFIKGPDFPTGGIICGTVGIKNAYKVGKGKVLVRAKCIIEDGRIIINEIPYMVNKSLLIEGIADLVREKVIEGIRDIRDESDREGMRIVIFVKKDFSSEIILNQLYKHTSLQVTFGINNVVLVENKPKTLGLYDLIKYFVDHRKDVITRRTMFDLRKAEERAHILNGLIIALNDIDNVVALIKKSHDVDVAKNGLIANYGLTEIQAKSILEMRLQRLTSLEQNKLRFELEGLKKLILDLKDILANPKRILEIIKNELIELKEKYNDSRRTKIEEGFEELETEDLIEEGQVVITVTNSGYVKRMPLNTYKRQGRGGRGVIGTGKKEEDFVEHLFVCDSKDYLMFFTNTGKVHWLKAYNIPEGTRYARGSAIVNLIEMKGEKLNAVKAVKEFKDGLFLVMGTKNGVIKKTRLSEYSRPRKGGIIGINLKEGDELVDVLITDGSQELIIATEDGRAVRFNEQDVSVVGRNSQGARGIKVRGSKVVGLCVRDDLYLLTITEKGFGKRSKIEDYRLINRGGSGVLNIKITAKNGKVVGIKVVNDYDDIILITKEGVVIRINVSSISVVGRNSQGVKVMRLSEEDKIVSFSKVVNEEDEEEIIEEKVVNEIKEEPSLEGLNVNGINLEE